MKYRNSILSNLIALCFVKLSMADDAAGSGDKRQKVCEKSFDEDDNGNATGVVRFTFTDGDEQVYNTKDFTAEMQVRLMVHGALQKGGDSYAGVKGNVGQAKANVKEIFSQIKNGSWHGERGEAGPRLGELSEAIARIKGVDVEKARAAVEKATDEQRKTWRSNAKVKAMIATIRAENAQKELQAAGEQELAVEL